MFATGLYLKVRVEKTARTALHASVFLGLLFLGCTENSRRHSSADRALYQQNTSPVVTERSATSGGEIERSSSGSYFTSFGGLVGRYERSSTAAFDREMVSCQKDGTCVLRLVTYTAVDSVSATLKLSVELRKDTIFVNQAPDIFQVVWPDQIYPSVDVHYETYDKFIDLHYNFSREMKSVISYLDSALVRKSPARSGRVGRVYLVPSTRLEEFNRRIASVGGRAKELFFNRVVR